eukprot:CAMPEP_0175124046 /NCGR_PEP_ID=MMETSP0087-20121206/2568_1 /TAXON_ID=136419 /ORGANISM="Unknown Unknown, Strain D1" /LENGTH=399 /DNA_ID=CAMNT_0016405779 /DNA_START=102 /DNA_END=1301 /DNA_ORIENTATION=-
MVWCVLVWLICWFVDSRDPQKIILDVDTAGLVRSGLDVDDDLAVLYALGHPALEVLGITVTYGNARQYQTFANAQRLVNSVALVSSTVPVLSGSDWYSRDLLAPTPAVEFIRDTVMAHPKKVAIVCLGALSNIAAALTIYPEIEKNIESFVLMGGRVDGFELNFFADMAATKVVFNASVPKAVLPVEILVPLFFRNEDVSKLRSRCCDSGHTPAAVCEYLPAMDNAATWNPVLFNRFVYSARPVGAGFHPWDLAAIALLTDQGMFGQYTEYSVQIHPGSNVTFTFLDKDERSRHLLANLAFIPSSINNPKELRNHLLDHVCTIRHKSSDKLGSFSVHGYYFRFLSLWPLASLGIDQFRLIALLLLLALAVVVLGLLLMYECFCVPLESNSRKGEKLKTN